MSRWQQRLVVAVSVVAAVAAVVLCAVTAASEWDRVSDLVTEASVGWLVVAGLCSAAAMTAIALAWTRSLAVVGAPGSPPGRVVAWYFAGELGKYLPGGVWPIVGRAELARRGGVARTVAYTSVLVSLLALYGAALLPLALIAFHPAVFGRVVTVGARVVPGLAELRIPSFGESVRLLLSYLPAWAFISACTLATVEALDLEGTTWRLVAATVLSWVVGFAALPVPAGAGVREGVFVALSGLGAAEAVTVAVTCRLGFLLADGVGGVLAGLVVARTERSDDG